jgi:NADP-reducing hydrogenase subunit HndD
MEAAIRTVYEIVTGRPLPTEGLHVAPIMGLEGVKFASLKIEGAVADWSFLEGVELKVAVAHGFGNTRQVIELMKSQPLHFVEVMSCPGGCISGGGQPRFTDNKIRKQRLGAIYKEDEGKKLRKSHENPEIQQIYKEFLGKPLSEISHKLLHTHYSPKK